jgi:hypothetical protein
MDVLLGSTWLTTHHNTVLDSRRLQDGNHGCNCATVCVSHQRGTPVARLELLNNRREHRGRMQAV